MKITGTATLAVGDNRQTLEATATLPDDINRGLFNSSVQQQLQHLINMANAVAGATFLGFSVSADGPLPKA